MFSARPDILERAIAALLLWFFLFAFVSSRQTLAEPKSEQKQARLTNGKSEALITCKSLSENAEKADPVSFELRCKTRRALLKIVSKGGIGSASIKFTPSYKPEVLEICFVGLTNLESLTIANGKVKIDTSLSASKRAKTDLKATKGTPPGVNIEKTKYGVIVQIPGRLVYGAANELQISWIDWFR